MDYQKAYSLLFNAITDAFAELDKENDEAPQTIRAKAILQGAQQRTEDMYTETEPEELENKTETGGLSPALAAIAERKRI